MPVNFIKIILLAVFAFLLNTESYSQQQYQFIQRSDNDILASPDSVSQKQPCPEVFNKTLSRFLNKRKKQAEKEEALPFKYLQTFRVRTPDSNSVFASEIDESSFGMHLFLFYFNEQNQTCSDPVEINATFMKNDEEGFGDWNGKMLEKPLVSFEDIDGDGMKELKFNRRAHNGTWNAVETIVYKLSDSKINKWFSFCSKELKDVGTETMIKRKIKSIGNGIVVLGVTAYDTTFQISNDMPDETIAIGQK